MYTSLLYLLVHIPLFSARCLVARAREEGGRLSGAAPGRQGSGGWPQLGYRQVLPQGKIFLDPQVFQEKSGKTFFFQCKISWYFNVGI